MPELTHSQAAVPFSITATGFCWINGQADDPQDLCSHGEVTVQAGPESVSYFCCTSAAGLRMLRTLSADRSPQDGLYGEQMLPCCGFSMYADETLKHVTISGCDSGADYSVRHQGGTVILTFENGHSCTVRMEDYSREVLHFARQIEAFYAESTPKKLPQDIAEQNGYAAFWNEWNCLMQEWNNCS